MRSIAIKAAVALAVVWIANNVAIVRNFVRPNLFVGPPSP